MKHSFVVQKIFVGLALSLAPVEAQRGYQLSGDEVVVDLAQHWRQWKIPAHLAHIDEAGSVRTRQLADGVQCIRGSRAQTADNH